MCISSEVLQQIFSSSEDPGHLFGSLRKCIVLVWCDIDLFIHARDAEEQRTLALG